MRALLLALIALLPPALAPLAGGTHAGVLCPEVDFTAAGDGVVLMPPLAAVTGFAPECLRIPSGGDVVFASVDVLSHPVGRFGCFLHGFGPGNPVNNVRAFTFTYDGSTLAVDGTPCPPGTFAGTPAAAAIRYFCYNHVAMQGIITVEAA